MSKLGSFRQQTREIEHYVLDYSCYLDATLPEELDPAPPTLFIAPTTVPPLVVGAAVEGISQIRVVVSGGVDNTDYQIDVLALTDAGRQPENELIIRVRDV